ncbi:hypothetical protein GLAREA_08240 [Glarea lozoyensis ATCC 20868]|uniref:Mitochondrial intermembrane space import and assembly protein 40 n=1 Tax=Glarea lozoyensis (strain ATCC 20868 / MF5171) TaxID=1116229 RepID=S3DCI3_GLAL2|nr:uncharacterized protein GLAREA_08240 [Glarea lozoyensis ATCC 20868]EPE24388.1 hypothetical protein GLAREA_08240 [Glarea lozoyensis ATCC 20868]
MFKTALRATPRRITPTRTVFQNTSSRRFLSTAPPSQKSRSWKSSAMRWALAAGGVYYYNTSNLFAEEPESTIQKLDESIHHVQESRQPTIDAIVEEKRNKEAQRQAEEEQQRRNAERAITQEGAAEEEHEEGGLGGLEEEADQQGAFNPETGEINWDCPCLGGMAHGPCGEEFRAAFSCFVYSTEEPKGVECIEKFKGMQDCFRAHPEEYGAELEDDEEEVEQELRARQQDSNSEKASTQAETLPLQAEPSQEPPKVGTEVNKKESIENTEPYRDSTNTKSAEATKSGDEGGHLVPKSAHDAS